LNDSINFPYITREIMRFFLEINEDPGKRVLVEKSEF